jgi:hypothetical protein
MERVIAYCVYVVAVTALILAIWRRVSEADRADAELERRNTRSP